MCVGLKVSVFFVRRGAPEDPVIVLFISLNILDVSLAYRDFIPNSRAALYLAILAAESFTFGS